MTISEAPDVWARLAAPLAAGSIRWRQDGRPTERADGKFFARFVPYIDQQTVLDRLNADVSGWDFSIQKIERVGDELFSASGSLTVKLPAGDRSDYVSRAGVGEGRSPKAAATDAFKRAAVLFGIGHELYEMKPVSVQMSDGSKVAKPLQDPALVWAKRQQAKAATGRAEVMEEREPAPGEPYVSGADDPVPVADAGVPPCPKCGGKMWDNRVGKRNPKAPDFKCRDRSCDGVIWPSKDAFKAPRPAEAPAAAEDDDDDLPW